MKSKIRNAYQKIHIGDVVGYRTFSIDRYVIAMGTVTEKRALGELRVEVPGKSFAVSLYAADVLGITRNGVPID